MNRTRFGLIAGLMAMLLLFSGCSQNDSVDSVSGATQKGMILQKQEFQGDPDSFRAFLQEKGVRIIPA